MARILSPYLVSCKGLFLSLPFSSKRNNRSDYLNKKTNGQSRHPERHGNLSVRPCGLPYVCMTRPAKTFHDRFSWDADMRLRDGFCRRNSVVRFPVRYGGSREYGLRQGGSNGWARTTSAAGFQLGHTTPMALLYRRCSTTAVGSSTSPPQPRREVFL